MLSCFPFQLTNNKDQKLLHQLNFEANQTIGVRTVTCTNGASANAVASVADDEVTGNALICFLAQKAGQLKLNVSYSYKT